ncbi:Neuronal PAS domain-containing protein 4A [Eumeta japonica]|uniref:Neuronal PAS domain-containing protein 4A n=1 Tax=Eumeta variegata TaxID=151549 RepID=A0A4C1VX09_EUMVA|nr:Neuronal PAS domain-containing protein 4A [Eumeta japonica]
MDSEMGIRIQSAMVIVIVVESDIVQCRRFDQTKSTKGASKLRRDLINAEIANLRDLLPLPPSTRQRLSQLQLMALVCVYVRKSNYFQQGIGYLTVGELIEEEWGDRGERTAGTFTFYTAAAVTKRLYSVRF